MYTLRYKFRFSTITKVSQQASCNATFQYSGAIATKSYRYLPVNKFSYRKSVVSRLLKRNLTLLLTPTDIRAYASTFLCIP